MWRWLPLRFEEAIRDYGRAIEANPKKATYYSNRAMASLKVMNFAGAEEDCNQALKLELNAKTLLRRGTARLGLHDFDGSEKDFKQVITLCSLKLWRSWEAKCCGRVVWRGHGLGR